MKLKEFLKQFDGLDPEIEIGINHAGWLNRKVVPKFWYCHPDDLNKRNDPKIRYNYQDNFVKILSIGFIDS